MGRLFHEGMRNGQSRRDYKEDMDMFVIMGRVQGGGQSREATTNRRTSFSSFDVFKETSDHEETTIGMPSSLWDMIEEIMCGGKEI